MRDRRGWVFLACALALTGLLLDTPARAQDVPARIDEIFSFATRETPGCAVGVSQDGNVIVNRAYGLADVERGIPFSPNSASDIGSVHKQVIAAAVLLLVEDGRLSLSDDVRQHLRELPDYGDTIMLDHLLTHTGGIRDWPGMLQVAEEGVDVLRLILRQRGINFKPGQEWSYSSSGYVLLKEVVARASGMSFAEFARSRLLEPLGMTSSSYAADILQGTGERALAYRREGNGWREYMRLGNERAGGTVISTAGDLLVWNEALTSGRLGAFVTGKLHEQAVLDNGRKLSYGRGLFVTDVPGGPMVWHDGGAAGYGTWLGRFAEHGLSVAVMCNFEPVSVSTLAGRVADVFLPPVNPEAQPHAPVAAPGVDVAGREGLYIEDGTGEPLRLIVNRGRLIIGGRLPLVPVSADRFRPARPNLHYRSEDDFEVTFRSSDELELTSMEGQRTRYRRAPAYAPPAVEVQAYDGRYYSEEFGRVFEILPGADGLVWRFEGAPETALKLEPVARDTYVRIGNTDVLRFRRDENGNVTGFDWSNTSLRNVRVTRVGARRASQAPQCPIGAAPQGRSRHD
jgi:CubicO group peptidase (beta-lactamase class C family)